MDKKAARKMVSDALTEIHAENPITVERVTAILHAFLVVNDHNGDDARVAEALDWATGVAKAAPVLFRSRWPPRFGFPPNTGAASPARVCRPCMDDDHANCIKTFGKQGESNGQPCGCPVCKEAPEVKVECQGCRYEARGNYVDGQVRREFVRNPACPIHSNVGGSVPVTLDSWFFPATHCPDGRPHKRDRPGPDGAKCIHCGVALK